MLSEIKIWLPGVTLYMLVRLPRLAIVLMTR